MIGQKSIAALACLGMVWGAGVTGFAADETPRATFVFKSSGESLADFEYSVKTLAGKTDAWDTIKESVEVLLEGVATDAPIRFDTLLGDDETSYLIVLPLAPANDVKPLLDNLRGAGIKSQSAGKGDLYRLAGDYKGFLSVRGNYALIAPEEKWFDLIGASPRDGANQLLGSDRDFLMRVENGAAGMDLRRSAFDNYLQKALDKLKRKQGESDASYKLRTSEVTRRMHDVQRYFAEAESIEMDWTTDANSGTGRGALTLKALAGTSLADSLNLIGKTKTTLSVKPSSTGAVSSSRILFPLDDFRRGMLRELYQNSRPAAEEKVDLFAGYSAEQKQAAKDALKVVFNLLDEGLSLEAIDGFSDLIPATQTGLYNLRLGIRCKNGRQATRVIEMIPRIEPGAKVNPLGTESGFDLFQISLTEKSLAGIKALFGPQAVFSVAVSDEAILMAVGDDSTTVIKTLVTEHNQAEPTTSSRVLSITGELRPWLAAIDAQLTERGEQGNAYRGLAIQSLGAGEGKLTVTLDGGDDAVRGETTIDRALLKLVGAFMAKFAEENL